MEEGRSSRNFEVGVLVSRMMEMVQAHQENQVRAIDELVSPQNSMPRGCTLAPPVGRVTTC